MPWQQYRKILADRITPERAEKWCKKLDPAAWASESYKLALSNAYAIPRDGQLATEYFDRNRPVIEQCLAMAGVRLATLLNSIFGGTACESEPSSDSGRRGRWPLQAIENCSRTNSDQNLHLHVVRQCDTIPRRRQGANRADDHSRAKSQDRQRKAGSMGFPFRHRLV